MELPFRLETEREARICADAQWKKGAVWGKPRAGHSEGVVMYHIAEVLANVDRLALAHEERRNLRLIALIHDAFKYRGDPSKLRIGVNHHAVIARKFAERYLDDLALLEIIELHDEAYNSWRVGASKGRWKEAEERASRLVARLSSSLPLYMRFYRADNATGSKDNDSLIWFEQFLRGKGIDVPPEVGGAR